MTVELRDQHEPVGKVRDQVWQTDITFLPTLAGWLYHAVDNDAYNKRVIGWAFSASLATDFVIVALLMAVQRRGCRCAHGLLLHSDRVVQYAGERFRAQLAVYGTTATMSRRGNCYDNTRAKSFFSTLKIDRIYLRRFVNHEEARQSAFEWIGAFYYLRRRHSAIGYLWPIDFENKTN